MEKFNFKNLKRMGMILIASGPSGAGKSTICKKVMEEDTNLVFSISCTTRPPREGEVDGVDYKFISVDRFKELIEQDAFIEHAKVHNNYYGTLKSEVYSRVREGYDVLLDIDVQGALNIQKTAVEEDMLKLCAEYIFISPIDSETLAKRLRGRASDSEEVINTRLKNSLWEVGNHDAYDYLIVNDELDKAVDDFKAVLTALRLKTKRIHCNA